MPATANDDIIAKLLQDHEQVKRTFARLTQADAVRRGEVFCELTNELVRHEVAEEEVLYPEVRKVLPEGNRLADERIAEQAEAEELLAKLEKTGPSDASFMTEIAKLERAVLAHAEKEEQSIFAPLGDALDQERREQLGSRYEKAKAAAPTHPHPHAPDSPPGNLVLGPVAALVDRTRDAMHKVAS